MIEKRRVFIVQILLILRRGNPSREEVVVICWERGHRNDLTVLRVDARNNTFFVSRSLHPPRECVNRALLRDKINGEHHALPSDRCLCHTEFSDDASLHINLNLPNTRLAAQRLFVTLFNTGATDVIKFIVSGALQRTQLQRINTTNVANHVANEFSIWILPPRIKDHLNTRKRRTLLFDKSRDDFINNASNSHRLPD